MSMRHSEVNPKLQFQGGLPSPGLDLLDARPAAAYLDVSYYTLTSWRKSEGVAGPPYIKVGRKYKYLKSDLDAWLWANRVGAN